jgi:ATP-dependent DNA helicase RecG
MMDAVSLAWMLADLRQRGADNAEVEVKRAQRGLPHDLWETVSAFANTAGGLVALGLDEGSGFQVTGVDDPAAAEHQLAAVCAEMEPPIRAEITTLTMEGRAVVVMAVPAVARDQRPCFRRSLGPYLGSRFRVADGNRKLTEYEVGLLISNQREPRHDQTPVSEADLASLDDVALSSYVARLRETRPSAFAGRPDDYVLLRANVLVETEGRLVPTLAGLLAFGHYPQQFFPQLNVSVVRYPTAEPGVPGPRGERFLDSVIIDGSIAGMLRDTVAAMKRNMQRRSLVMGLFRQDEWEYPEVAIREAVVNALVHRDLSVGARGTQVQIEMYPDRLVIRNPGGLYGPVGIDDLGLAGISASRNRALLKILSDTPADHRQSVCENVGSGIFTMRRALADAGMEPPEFRDNVATFEAAFPNHTLLDQETLEWITRLGLDNLNGPQMIALAMARRGQPVTNKSFRAATGVPDSREAGRLMRDLVDRGAIVMEGTRGSAIYVLADRADASPSIGGRRRSTDAEAAVLRALAKGLRSREDIEVATGLSRHTVTYQLRRLRALGRVELVGKERSRRALWRLIDR